MGTTKVAYFFRLGIISLSLVILCGCSGQQKYRLAYIDIKEVFEKHPKTTQARKNLAHKEHLNQQHLDILRQEIYTMKEALKYMILPLDQMHQKYTELAHKEQEFKNLQQQLEQQLQQYKEKLTEEILKDIYLVVKQIAQEKKIDLIVDSSLLLYYRENIEDITEQTIKHLLKRADGDDALATGSVSRR